MKVVFKDKLGSDLTVVNAARVSFAKESSFDVEQNFPYKEVKRVLKLSDEKLIKYLAEHNHWSPFGHAQLQILIEAPIFIARQLVKHQVGLVWNEVSRRYVDDPVKLWFPENWTGRPIDKKQGADENTIISTSFDQYDAHIRNKCWEMVELYNDMISKGIAPEEARIVLPLNMYTEWWWTGSLYAFARVCNLRCKPDAQKATRQIGNAIAEIVKEHFPISAKYLLK